MKKYYPIEFYNSLLSVFHDSTDKVIVYSIDAKKHGINILRPHVNDSFNDFSIKDDKTIITGFGSVKGIGEKAILYLESLQPFIDEDDFVLKIKNTKITKTVIESLAFTGALDDWLLEEDTRLSLLCRILTKSGRKFDYSEDFENYQFTKTDLLNQEKRLLGSYFSGHPLEDVAEPIIWEDLDTNEKVSTTGIISNIKEIITKKGEPMAFITFSFLEKELDTIVFPNTYNKPKVLRKIETTTRSIIRKGMLVDIKGHLSYNHLKDANDFFIDDIHVPIIPNKKIIDEIQDSL